MSARIVDDHCIGCARLCTKRGCLNDIAIPYVGCRVPTAQSARNETPCTNCACHDPDHGCLDLRNWHPNVPTNPPCHAPILYRHIDGEGLIAYDRERSVLEVSDEVSGLAVDIPIGPTGMLEMARALIAAALEAERA